MTESKTAQPRAFSSTYIFGKIMKIGAVLAVLYFISFWNFLLFHSLVEFGVASFSIAIFLLAWNARKFSENTFYIFIGTFLAVAAVVTIFHAFAYRGIGIFPGTETDANLATQLWLANQYILVIGFLAAPFVIKKKVRPILILAIFGAIGVALMASIFWWHNFPTAYAEGSGLTEFKNISEYVVAGMFFLSAFFFMRIRKQLEPRVLNLFLLVLLLLFFSTILFTRYVGVYGPLNVWGHLVRLAAIYPIYIAVIEFGLMNPYRFLFGNLKEREKELAENEKQLRAVVEDQTELICRFRPDGTLTFVNDAYCRYYGKSKSLLIGKKYFDFVLPEIVEQDKKRLQRLSSANPVSQVEHQALSKKGWRRWQHWSTRAIFDVGNKLVEYQSVGRDITEQKFAQEALQNSEKQFRALVDNSLVGVYRASRDGSYSYVNDAMAKMFEFNSTDDLMSESAKVRYLSQKDRQKFLNILKQNGRITNYELTGLTKYGNKINVLSSATIVGDEISGMLINITDRKKAEEDLKRAAEEWLMTFNSISDPIFILDPNHTIIKANQALLDFFGKTEQEIVGRKCYEVVHKMHGPWKTCPLVMTKKSGKSHTEEVEDPNLGKTLLVTTSPIKNNRGEIKGVAHIAKDITERKKIEKNKDEFLSLASHQLRTPLSSIALSSELLLRGVAGEMEAGRKEYVSEIFKATKKMTLLVNNLLNISRVEMGTFGVNLGPFDLIAAIDSVIKEFLPLYSEKNLNIDVHYEKNIPLVSLEEKIFGIIFENIFSNAIRYTSAGGNITIKLANTSKGVRLEVADTGCGITDREQGKIFKKSFRAKNAKEISSEGSGLGMYMAKIAADRVGAKISFESTEGKGTKFFVLFRK